MSESKTVSFKIESLESQGMGVSKVGDKITFIQKVIPGEEGRANIYASKKNVQFATIDSLSLTSDKRIKAECEHFSQCGGCHFQQLSYMDELEYKRLSLLDIFERQNKISIKDQLKVIGASRRFHYRNRVQLHYDLNKEQLGFHSGDNSQIIHTPHCLMPNEALQQSFSDLYKDNSWKKYAKAKRKGHIEIYERHGKTSIVANARYSHEGFSQVYDEMNNNLLEFVKKYIHRLNISTGLCLDLFGGSGNLSRDCANQVLVVDATPEKYIKLQSAHQSYLMANLFKPDGIRKTLNAIHKQNIELLIIDPPRSGFKEIEQITQEARPKHILYVSCNPQTIARDIKKLENEYQIIDAQLYDFFPATRHYETVMTLRHKKY